MTLFVQKLEISGKFNNEEQSLNNLHIFLTFLVFSFDISLIFTNELQPSKIHSKLVISSINFIFIFIFKLTGKSLIFLYELIKSSVLKAFLVFFIVYIYLYSFLTSLLYYFYNTKNL